MAKRRSNAGGLPNQAAPTPPETVAPETVAPETVAPETVAPETVAPDAEAETVAPVLRIAPGKSVICKTGIKVGGEEVFEHDFASEEIAKNLFNKGFLEVS